MYLDIAESILDIAIIIIITTIIFIIIIIVIIIAIISVFIIFIVIIIIIIIVIILIFTITITQLANMLAVTASRFSTSDMWRKPKDEGAKERLPVGSWRERRVSQESGGIGGMSGNWRVRQQKEAAEADRPKVYGGSMPPEYKLVGMYKHFKEDNAEFTTWLVESVYPSVGSLPFWITLEDKQAEGER